MKEEDFKGLNTEQAKREFEDRKRQQDEHLEKTFGPMRDKIETAAEEYNNFAVLNFILSIHTGLANKTGMDLLNTIQSYMLVHYNGFEAKVRKIVELVGEERIEEELGIKISELYPTEYCTRGLQEIQKAARDRARMGKYGIKVEAPRIIT